MTRIRFVVVFSLFSLAACGTSEERYAEKYPEFYCAYIQSCDPPFYDTVDECAADVSGESFAAECTFNEEAADACLAELSGLVCEGSASNYPAVCNEAWVCP
jgi:hypothetical protein